ncbi:MAG TPA: SAM-dependent methyltransferase [Streptosporangiaceae bacterium]|nr:SAM-dependent methyltransferase [Streptosporangiaceae bacterium]
MTTAARGNPVTGSPDPAANNTHEVAQSAEPETRVVYVDNDPIVLTHARALLASGPRGATQYVDGDLREPDKIIKAATILDFSQPIALMLFGIMHLVTDDEAPYRIVAQLMDPLPPGSYLALSHPASDTHQGQAEAQRRYNERVSTPQQLRSRDEVMRFFEGLELVEPGLVQVHLWRPDPTDEIPAADAVSAYGAVARKP